MSYPTKKISPLPLLEEGTHVPVVPKGQNATCHTQRTHWPKKGGEHVPMLAILLSKKNGVVVVLMPRACGSPGRRSNIFLASELVLYTGEIEVPEATADELSEISVVREASKTFQRAVRAEIAQRHGSTPASTPRAAIISAT